MSDVQVFTTREVAEKILAVLEPMREERRQQASSCPGFMDAEQRAIRAHFIGEAQALTDAIEALLPEFGVESPGGRVPQPCQQPVVEQVGTGVQVDRVVANRGRDFGSRHVRRAS